MNNYKNDFGDLFEDHKHHKPSHDHHYARDDYYQSSYSDYRQNDFNQQLLYRIRINPKLKILLIVVAIIIVAVVIIMVILFFPLILKLFSFISENGIQGLINSIWNGTK